LEPVDTGLTEDTDNPDTDTPDDTDTPEDTGTPEPCTNTLESVLPTDGATLVDVETTIQVGFSEPVVDGQWSVELNGVTGQTSVDAAQTTVTFVPDEPLDYETNYTVTAEVCEVTASAGFTTTAEPLDMTLLDSRTYELPYVDLVWQKPNAISLLSAYIDFDSFLVQVDAIDVVAETLTVLAAVGYDNGGIMEPDCASLFSPGLADFSQNPVFSAGPSDMMLPISSMDLTIEDFALSANFNSDGSSIENVLFTGLADTRALDSTLGDTCGLAAFMGDTCIACADGEIKCLELEATAQEATWNSAVDLAAECP
jgi:hypothetical protein